jgi:LysR family transcriptional regulator, positive regulator for ilvC
LNPNIPDSASIMDIRALRAFESLAYTLHFGRAAAQCNVSSSTLSRMIRRLEHELGCRLFERSSRVVRLTREGETLRGHSEDLLEKLEALRRGLVRDAPSLGGTVSLYCSVTASYSILAELLPAYRREFPRVEVKIHTGDESVAIRRVQSGQEDLAIVACPDRLPQGLRFVELVSSPLVFIAPASMTLPEGLMPGARRKATVRAWCTQPFVMPESGLARERIDQWFGQLGVSPLVYAQVSGNEAIAGMVALGMGCAVVPLLVLRESPFRDRIRLMEVVPALPSFRIGLCCRARSLANPLVHSLWQHASSHWRRG